MWQTNAFTKQEEICTSGKIPTKKLRANKCDRNCKRTQAGRTAVQTNEKAKDKQPNQTNGKKKANKTVHLIHHTCELGLALDESKYPCAKHLSTAVHSCVVVRRSAVQTVRLSSMACRCVFQVRGGDGFKRALLPAEGKWPRSAPKWLYGANHAPI